MSLCVRSNETVNIVSEKKRALNESGTFFLFEYDKYIERHFNDQITGSRFKNIFGSNASLLIFHSSAD